MPASKSAKWEKALTSCSGVTNIGRTPSGYNVLGTCSQFLAPSETWDLRGSILRSGTEKPLMIASFPVKFCAELCQTGQYSGVGRRCSATRKSSNFSPLGCARDSPDGVLG